METREREGRWNWWWPPSSKSWKGIDIRRDIRLEARAQRERIWLGRFRSTKMMKSNYFWACGLVVLSVAFGVAQSQEAAANKAELSEQAPREVTFDPVRIDGPIHDPAKHTYW